MTSITNKPSLGKQFRQLREQKGLLIRQVSAVTEMDQAIISKIENSDRIPTREQVTKLAGLYDMNLNEVLSTWLAEKLVKEYGKETFAADAMRTAETTIMFNLLSVSPDKETPNSPPQESNELF